MKFGPRVVKTAIATLLSIIISQLVGIKDPLSVGIFSILGLEVTKKRNVSSLYARIFASFLGLGIACLLFLFLGFKLWVLFIYILFAFPIMSNLNFKDGIMVSSVAVFHVYGQGKIDFMILSNEILSAIIGLGSAACINLIYMPTETKRILALRREIDQLFSDICLHFARQLRDTAYIWDGKELIELEKSVTQGIQLAQKDSENQLFRQSASWLIYFVMRKQQLDSIRKMLFLVSQVYQDLPHSLHISELFLQLSEDVKEDDYSGRVELLWKDLLEEFKQKPLPQTREEFETRSALLQLCRELEQFLMVAKESKWQLKFLILEGTKK